MTYATTVHEANPHPEVLPFRHGRKRLIESALAFFVVIYFHQRSTTVPDVLPSAFRCGLFGSDFVWTRFAFGALGFDGVDDCDREHPLHD